MFATYPGFEDLPVYLLIMENGQARAVTARIEEWPASRRAVVVCAYEDQPESGEWLIVGHQREPVYLSHANSLKRELMADEVHSAAQNKRFHGLLSTIRKAFNGRDSQFQRARVCHLPDLPAEPRLALCDAHGCSWHRSWQTQPQTLFEVEGIRPLEQCEPELKEALRQAWGKSDSDARFAWRWAQWSNAERRRQLLGEIGDYQEVSRVMRWVLLGCGLCADVSWRSYWQLRPFPLDDESIDAFLLAVIDSKDLMLLWHRVLLSHFAPDLRHDWIERHLCARDFWNAHGAPLGMASVGATPSAHEQLEAHLLLREWIRDNAAPAEAATLLATLLATLRSDS